MTAQQKQKDFRKILKWGLIVFFVVNAFSWNPGWGGRHDRLPGLEIERFFGWPAVYYCDLWRSDHHHQIALPLYFPPIPLSYEMSFVYFSGSVAAFLLNTIFAVCVVGVCLLLVASEGANVKAWMKYLGIGFTMIALLIFLFGDEFSAYL